MKVKELKELINALPDEYEVMYKSDTCDWRDGHETNMVNRITIKPTIKEVVLE